MALQKPEKNDALVRALQGGDPATWKKMRSLPDYQDKINLKLKTRLFLPKFEELRTTQLDSEANLAQFVRCQDCNATLLLEIAVQNYDENIVLPQYEPLDKESLVNQFCEILKSTPIISKEMLDTT